MAGKNIYIEECWKQKRILALIVVMLIIDTFVVFKIPFKLEAMNNQLFNLSRETYKDFLLYFFYYVGFSMVQIGVFLALNITYKYLSNQITSSIVLKLYQKIYNAKIKCPPQFTVDEIMQTVNVDAYKLGDNGVKIFFQTIRLIINIVGLLFYMVVTNVYLAVLITFNFLIIMLIQSKLNRILADKLKILKKIYGKYAYTSNTFFGKSFNYRQIKAEKYFTRKVKNDMQEYLEHSFSIEKTSSLNTVFGSLSNLLNIMIIMGIGAYMLIRGNITLGILITFSTFGTVFGNYLSSIPGLFMQMKEFGISYDRVMKIMNIDCHEDDKMESTEKLDLWKKSLKEKIYSIRIKNIQFSYNDGRKIINDFSFNFDKDNIYCIVGENGTGKTTLVNLLLGEYPVKDGCIEINSQNINLNECRNTYNNHISYCSSSWILFDDSVKNNIILDQNVEEGEISKIMKELQIEKDPALQIDREIDTMRDNLSDGQKQKLSIVRCILGNTEIMIFDEIEMHLDQETKSNVMKYLKQIKKERIIIVVSHDNYIIEQSDVVINL